MVKKIKKIVLVSAYSCCPDKGSEPGYGWNYLLQYAKNFETVFLITSQIDYTQLLAGIKKLNIDNVIVRAIKLPSFFENLRRFPIGGVHLHYFLWLWKAQSVISKEFSGSIDFAHHVTFGSLQFGSALGKLKCPFIFGPVGGGQRTNKIFYPLMGKAKYAEQVRNLVSHIFYRYNPLFKKTIQNAGLIYCSNYETKRELSNYLVPSHHSKMKMMLDTSLNADFLSANQVKAKKDDCLSLLWVGRLLPRKGLEIMLDAAKLIENENFHLTIVGDGPLRKKVKDMIQKNGLEKKVHFAGQIDYLKIIDYYRSADVLLFFSYRDSVGIQILEALSQGLPVISFDQFGASILINEQIGIKIPVENNIEFLTQNIAHNIHKLINDRNKVKWMGQNAFTYACHFSWVSKMQTILTDINTLLIDEDTDMRFECV